MECCDVELIGALTGVLAHFRYKRRGSRKEVKTEMEMGEKRDWWGLAWRGSGRRREVGGRAGSEAHSTPYFVKSGLDSAVPLQAKGLTQRGEDAKKTEPDLVTTPLLFTRMSPIKSLLTFESQREMGRKGFVGGRAG